MDDKLYCEKCGFRIWRNMDGRFWTDLYFQGQHFNCDMALATKPPMKPSGEPDLSYREAKVEEPKRAAS